MPQTRSHDGRWLFVDAWDGDGNVVVYRTRSDGSIVDYVWDAFSQDAADGSSTVPAPPGAPPDPNPGEPSSPTAPTQPSVTGGLTERISDAVVRPRLTRDAMAGFLPRLGAFRFPEPYGTLGVRLTNERDGTVRPVGMSYWPNINNHVGRQELNVLLSIDDQLTLFSVDKATGAMRVLGALPFRATGEGCYWSLTDPDALYVPQSTGLLRYDVTRASSVEVVAAAVGEMRQFHSSADGRVHSFTLDGNAAAWDRGTLRRFQSLGGGYDECFPAGTRVDGQPIESIKAGSFVTSFNHETGVIEQRRVIATRTLTCSERLARITLSSGATVICTERHRVYTLERGYVQAEDLNGLHCYAVKCIDGKHTEDRDYYMPALSGTGDNHRCALVKLRSDRPSALLESLRHVLEDGSASGFTENFGTTAPHVGTNADTDGDQESDAKFGVERKTARRVKSDGMEAASARRQWPSATVAAGSSSVGAWVAYGSGRKDRFMERPGRKAAVLLQDRHRKPDVQDCDRSRRSITRFETRAGREERSVFAWSRVDRVEILQPGSNGEFGGLCPGGVVYDLEVEKNHNFFADGVLVHNCQIDKSGRWLLIKEGAGDNRVVDLSTGREFTVSNVAGAVGHSDMGHGYVVGEDDYANEPGAFRLWTFTDGGPLIGPVVYRMHGWDSMTRYVSHCNAYRDGTFGQKLLFSSAFAGDLPRANELVAVRMGDVTCTVVCPNLSDLNARGGETDEPGDAKHYWKKPRANLDPIGEWACWTANCGTDRLDAFLVRLP